MSIALPPAPVRAPRRGRLWAALSDTLVLTQRSLRHIPRIPEQLIFATINPVIFVLLFRYVFGGAIETPGADYVDFLMAGILVQTVAFGAVNTGVGLAEDMHRGLIDRFRSLPMAPSAVLTGRILADVLRNGLVIAVGVMIGLVVGFRPAAGPMGWLASVGLLLLIGVAVSWASATVALTVRTAEATQSANYLWLLPLTFASSAFVPTDSMPAGLRTVAEHQPFTVVVDAVRALLLGAPLEGRGWAAVAWALGVIAVCAPIAVRRFRVRASR